jgi:16S rRNA (guanine527-N7)-methyltransferase
MPGEDAQKMISEMLSLLQLERDPVKEEKLLSYVYLILAGLAKQRLTGEKTYADIIYKQLFDSLYPIKTISFRSESRVLDLGSGAGLPGIPLKVYRPEISLYLMDSNKRKIEFLKEVAETLQLKNVHHLCGRAEEWGRVSGYREEFDLVLCKAVAAMAVLAELALPFVKIGGHALFYKGPRGEAEAAEAQNAIESCGGKIERVWQYSLPTGENRSLYLLEKIKETPLKFPRAAGKPSKNPIR